MFIRISKIFFSIIVLLFLTVSFVFSWTGIIADDGDILTFTKWNELVGYIDAQVWWSGANLWVWTGIFASVTGSGQMQFKSLVAGTGMTISSDASTVTIGKAGAWIWSLVSETISATGLGACTVSTIPYEGFINAYVETIIVTPWPEINPTGTIDADSTSTWDANLINNDYTDLIYNNSSAGTANKSLPWVDLWSSLAVWVARLYRWNPATYGVTDGKIQGSNNGTTWIDLVTWIVKTTGATGDSDDYSISGNYRYIRLFSVAWLNATWVTLAETEVFQAGSVSNEYVNIFNRDMEVRSNAGFVEVCNNESTANVEINSVQ